MGTIQAEMDQFLQDCLDQRLDKLTQPQRVKFGRCFPNGVPPEKMKTAIDLCDRTIRKNDADAMTQAGGDPMALPEGRSCHHCRHFAYCEKMIQCNPANTRCDWSPSRFEKAKKSAK